jgi:hypothetical protein
LHYEFSQPGQKKKEEGMEGAKGTFLGKLGPSHHLYGEKTKSQKYWRNLKYFYFSCACQSTYFTNLKKKKKKPLKSIDGLYSGMGETWLAS